MFKINYFKIRPLNLETLEKEAELTLDDVNHNYNPFKLNNLQYYNPVYNKYFELTDSTYNKIALNHKYHISSLNTITNLPSTTKASYIDFCESIAFTKFSIQSLFLNSSLSVFSMFSISIFFLECHFCTTCTKT